ncbi:hypothetical protein [Vogesella indigofera]|uniref:hypothetical protein n=1 Tax=Vogesella indigofera TaxID=45465 RepID=UPI003F42029F
MTNSRKKSQPWQRLASLDDLAMMFPNTGRHSTRPSVSRKPDMHGQCPVCNSPRYLGKQLALSLDGSQHRAAVCDGCHAAVSLSGGYALSVSHRLAQHQQYLKESTPC